ncbi:MAG: hypothetical protein EWM47_12020, partial [Anaerolineaceae bacterium]
MLAKGVFVDEYMKLSIREYDVPEPKANEVMIKTMACGLCCWDSWLYRGVNAPSEYPYIIGHEGAGIVEKVGENVTKFKPGDKVFCGSGTNEMMCEYATVPEAGLVKLPDDTTDWEKVIYEPTCCVTNLLDITDIRMGDHVVLVGAGYMGLLTLQALTRASQASRITVFELREDRRKMAEEYNPTEVLDPESEEGKKVIAEIIAKGGADVCIDFGATDSGFHLADSMTKQAGKLIIGSFHRGDVTFNGTKWHLGGLYVYNLAPMSNPHFKEIVPRTYDMIKRGIFEPGKLVTHTAYYEDMEAMDNIFKISIDKSD